MPGLKYRIQHQYWLSCWNNCSEKEHNAQKMHGDVQIVAILEEPVQEVKQDDEDKQMAEAAKQHINNAPIVAEFVRKQEEQEESQEEIWKDCLSKVIPGTPTQALIGRLKQHFKIQRR